MQRVLHRVRSTYLAACTTSLRHRQSTALLQPSRILYTPVESIASVSVDASAASIPAPNVVRHATHDVLQHHESTVHDIDAVQKLPHSEKTETTAGADSTKDEVHITDGNGMEVPIITLNTFTELTDIPEWLAEGLKRLGFDSTMGIQKHIIPLLNNGHDVIGLAPTGSGKTVAFAVPALRKFQPNDDGSPAVLVLAPTRELVQQIRQVFVKLSCGQVRIGEAYGGAPREMQLRRLQRGCDVLIACPGRLKDFLDSGELNLRQLSFLVFDEADRLLDMGFQIQLDQIMHFLDLSRSTQRMMWSATWPTAVRELSQKYLSPNRMLVCSGNATGGLQVNAHINQSIILAERLSDRIEHIAKLIEEGHIDENVAKVILFVERQRDTESAGLALSKRLNIDPDYVGVIHGGLSQRLRDSVMHKFKSSRIRLLVATDVASRGLDIPDVTCVVNLQAPRNIDSYCHRIGRTGRAGRCGAAYTFIGSDDGAIAGELVSYLGRCGMDVPSHLKQLASSYAAKMEARAQYNKQRRWGSSSSDGGDDGDDEYNEGRRFERSSSRERFQRRGGSRS